MHHRISRMAACSRAPHPVRGSARSWPCGCAGSMACSPACSQARSQAIGGACRSSRGPAVLALLLALGALPAHAAPGLPDRPARPFAVGHQPLPLPASIGGVVTPARSGPAGALDDTRLATLRGGTDTPWSAPWSDMKLNGTVDHNTASQIVTGANIVTDGAFSNASGLPMVIQNSGANVLIQSATIVNVQFR